jgi:hypothetical protein
MQNKHWNKPKDERQVPGDTERYRKKRKVLTKAQGIITYIGTYTRRESFVDGKAEGIYIYHLDPGSGELTYAATVTGESMVNPSFLTVSPDRRFLYAVNEISGDKGPHGTVSAFAVDPETGGLRYLNQQSTHGLAPCYVHVEPEGGYCLVANYETGNLGVLPIRPDGRLGEATDVVQFSGSGPNPERQAGPHAHMVLSDPAGDYILAVDLGTDRLMAFRLDRERSALVPAETPWTPAVAGLRPAPSGVSPGWVLRLRHQRTPIHDHCVALRSRRVRGDTDPLNSTGRFHGSEPGRRDQGCALRSFSLCLQPGAQQHRHLHY